MPALRLFGRRWHFGSDDFVGIGSFDLGVRLGWLGIAALSVMYYWTNTGLNFSCNGKLYIQIYLYGIFTILPLIIIVDAFLILNTLAGGMMDEHARRFVPLCLYFRVFFMMVEIAWTTLGSVWWLGGTMTCPTAPQAEAFARDRIISSWLIIVIWNFILWAVFDSTGGYNNIGMNITSTRRWETKFRLYFYNFFSGNRTMLNKGFEEAGDIMDTFFEDTDLVPTDVIAGATLLMHKYTYLKKSHISTLQGNTLLSPEERMFPVVTSEPLSSSLPESSSDKWNSLRIIYHVKKYAVAVFNWRTLVLGHSDPIKQLWRGSFCCGCLPHYPIDVEGDDCCYLGTSAIKAMTKIDDSDIVFVTFKNEVFQTPFFVAVDHATKSIIVALRGSFSINDVMVNLAAKPHPIGVPGLPESFTAHHGMLQCAQLVKEKLESLKVLQKLFLKYPNYNLALTGTSLGAGTATLLAFMLKADYPSLKCYAFSPPGLLLSLEAAEYCEDFVVSIVYENDVVPRTSLQSLETIKYQIAAAINTCKIPKYKVLVGGFFWYWFGLGFPTVHYDDDTSNLGDGNQYQPIINSCQDIAVIDIDNGNTGENDGNSNGNAPSMGNISPIKKLLPFENMYPPGMIMHITETESYNLGHKTSNYKGAPRWQFRWAQRSEFREIILSPRMIADHLPFRLYRALGFLSENCNEM